MMEYICYIEIIKKSMLLVSLGFTSGTNNVLLSLSNRDNTLGMLVSLGFASGTRQCLGYYLSINLWVTLKDEFDLKLSKHIFSVSLISSH